jgi:hypothetical protein
MALDKVPASADFFKQLSHDYRQLRFIIHALENFALGALMHGYEFENHYLLHIIEQLEILISRTQRLKDWVEEIHRCRNAHLKP